MAQRASGASGAGIGGSDSAGTEHVDQQITATLRAIDGDFVKAADLAASMLGDVRTFTANMKATHAGLQVRKACARTQRGVACACVPVRVCDWAHTRRSHQPCASRRVSQRVRSTRPPTVRMPCLAAQVWKDFFMGLAAAPRSSDDVDAVRDRRCCPCCRAMRALPACLPAGTCTGSGPDSPLRHRWHLQAGRRPRHGADAEPVEACHTQRVGRVCVHGLAAHLHAILQAVQDSRARDAGTRAST